jgi:hypothetical protein
MKLCNKISAPELDNTILLWKIHLYFKILFFQNYFPFENCIQWKVICIQNSYWILWGGLHTLFFQSNIVVQKFHFMDKFRRIDGKSGRKKANKRKFFLSKKWQCHYFWLKLNGAENEEHVHRYTWLRIYSFEKQILHVVFARAFNQQLKRSQQ